MQRRAGTDGACKVEEKERELYNPITGTKLK